MKPIKSPAREQKMRQEKQEKMAGEKEKSKSQGSKFCMPELRKLIFCSWIRRPQSVRPVTGFVVSFSS